MFTKLLATLGVSTKIAVTSVVAFLVLAAGGVAVAQTVIPQHNTPPPTQFGTSGTPSPGRELTVTVYPCRNSSGAWTVPSGRVQVDGPTGGFTAAERQALINETLTGAQQGAKPHATVGRFRLLSWDPHDFRQADTSWSYHCETNSYGGFASYGTAG